MGVPGWPELAACTASIDRVRMVLMQSSSRVASPSGAMRAVAHHYVMMWAAQSGVLPAGTAAAPGLDGYRAERAIRSAAGEYGGGGRGRERACSSTVPPVTRRSAAATGASTAA